MIARVSILLPFDLLIREGDELPGFELAAPDFHVRFHPPLHLVERPKLTDGGLDATIALRAPRAVAFSDSLLADGHRVGQVNVLVLDVSKPEFNRAIPVPADRMPSTDPGPDFVFAIANGILAKLRVYSRAFQIRELVPGRDPCCICYLNDDGEELKQEEGKFRITAYGQVTVGFPVLTPDVISMVASSANAEPYVWDQLLLDAYGLLPDVGGAIIMAATALETFIAWALDILHRERPLSPGLWEWINTRGDDHTKEPSVSDKFDVLLRAFTGVSLKDDAQLWQHHKELREARNNLVHRGTATIGRSRTEVDARKVRELVSGADKIVKWVELLLPEAYRRARTEAIGPFTRRLASQSTPVNSIRVEADPQNQGPIRVVSTEKPADPSTDSRG